MVDTDFPEWNAIEQIIGKKIRQGRKELNFTVNELCEKIGRSAPQLQKYETGQNRVSASLLMIISEIYNKPLSWFFEDDTDTPDLGSKHHQDTEFETCAELLNKLRDSPILPEVKNYLSVAVAAGRAR